MFLTDKERSETIWACRFCMMCHVADRVASVVRRESYTPRGRGAIMYALDKGMIPWDKGVAEIMYTTLNDGLLQEWCVGNYDHEELVLDFRAQLYSRGLAPEDVSSFLGKLRANPSPGTSPTQILEEAGVRVRPSADILLFCGCSARESQKSTVIAMGRLFNSAGIPFMVLPEEPCCGWPFYQLGDLEGARSFSIRVADALRNSGASKVVVLDADCHRMLLTRTVRFGGDLHGITVVHALQETAGWIDEGLLSIQRPFSGTVTYHDPCSLARYCDETESARKILGVLLEDTVKEMATSGKKANCCGGGGMLAVHRPEIARKVTRKRLLEAAETGAEVVATGCTRCTAVLGGVAAEEDVAKPLRVRHVVDMLAEAIE